MLIKILDSFLLNLPVFSFFLCLRIFLLKHFFFCNLGFSFASADFEKKIFTRIYFFGNKA